MSKIPCFRASSIAAICARTGKSRTQRDDAALSNPPLHAIYLIAHLVLHAGNVLRAFGRSAPAAFDRLIPLPLPPVRSDAPVISRAQGLKGPTRRGGKQASGRAGRERARQETGAESKQGDCWPANAGARETHSRFRSASRAFFSSKLFRIFSMILRWLSKVLCDTTRGD